MIIELVSANVYISPGLSGTINFQICQNVLFPGLPFCASSDPTAHGAGFHALPLVSQGNFDILGTGEIYTVSAGVERVRLVVPAGSQLVVSYCTSSNANGDAQAKSAREEGLLE